MRFFKRLAGFLGFAKDDGGHEAPFRSNFQETGLPRKGFSVPLQVAVERPQLGPVIVYCNSGDGGVQGLRWYAKRLRIDEDGDVADEFFDEVLPDTSSNVDEQHKRLLRFEVKYSTRPAKIKTQMMSHDGKIQQCVEHQGRLQWEMNYMGKPNEKFLTETRPALLSKRLLHTCMSDDLQHESFQQKTETRDRQARYLQSQLVGLHGFQPWAELPPLAECPPQDVCGGGLNSISQLHACGDATPSLPVLPLIFYAPWPALSLLLSWLSPTVPASFHQKERRGEEKRQEESMDLIISSHSCNSLFRKPAFYRRISSPNPTTQHSTSLKCRVVKTTSELQSSVGVSDRTGNNYSPSIPTHKVTVHDRQRGVVHEFLVPEDQYILHTAESQNITLPFACRHGCCTSCAVRVKSGQLRQPEALGISAELKSKGYALLCVGFPSSDLEVETQDEDEVYWLQFGRYFARGPIIGVSSE
ncbi:hypothetical protein NC653_008717 [Populus alba x Populus x berolinensis]|uniref:2Fe-2S ferredoxin-type domain-containing protein n=1 Tax=Populus alba x Populus x berolinensis TaxID=444605 RepID=A0AAD6R7D0_9ROSI|nr:hypothetical protein NC653_008717 [Populus alba x Populus x berolinensis]